MRTLLFVLLATIASAQTQTQEPVLGYAEDININGKTFERYQTPKGDNVLIGKEQAKANGVYLFKKAKDLLQEQGMFEFALVVPANQTYQDIPESAFDSLKIDGRPTKYSRKEALGSVAVGIRPTGYRHLRARGEFAFFPFAGIMMDREPDGDYYDGDDRSTVWLHTNEKSWSAFVDHDVLVIPVKRSFHAISAGYFVAQTGLQAHTFNPRTSGGWDVKAGSTSWVDQGLHLNYRAHIPAQEIPFTIEVTSQLGQKGTKRVSGALILSFGGRK